MTNIEYIRSLDDRGIDALLCVIAGGDIDIMAEQCNLCRYWKNDGFCGIGIESSEEDRTESVEECGRARWRWLYDECRALKEAVENEAEKKR